VVFGEGSSQPFHPILSQAFQTRIGLHCHRFLRTHISSCIVAGLGFFCFAFAARCIMVRRCARFIVPFEYVHSSLRASIAGSGWIPGARAPRRGPPPPGRRFRYLGNVHAATAFQQRLSCFSLSRGLGITFVCMVPRHFFHVFFLRICPAKGFLLFAWGGGGIGPKQAPSASFFRTCDQPLSLLAYLALTTPSPVLETSAG